MTGPAADDGAGSPAGAHGRPPRVRREVVVLVVTAVLTAVAVLWGADRLARVGAESLVVGELQRLTGTQTPQVELRGSSFLLSALSGRYDQVDVRLLRLSGGPLVVDQLDAELTGVQLPFAELVRRNPDVIGVESASSRAFLRYDDLDAYLDVTGRPYSVRAGRRAGELTLTGRVPALGRSYDVTVDARLGADDGALTVSPTRLDTGSPLDRAAELLLVQRFTFVVPLDPLPFGQQVTDIAAGTDGVVVRTRADGLLLRPR